MEQKGSRRATEGALPPDAHESKLAPARLLRGPPPPEHFAWKRSGVPSDAHCCASLRAPATPYRPVLFQPASLARRPLRLRRPLTYARRRQLCLGVSRRLRRLLPAPSRDVGCCALYPLPATPPRKGRGRHQRKRRPPTHPWHNGCRLREATNGRALPRACVPRFSERSPTTCSLSTKQRQCSASHAARSAIGRTNATSPR